jgi:hypothetical protein
MDMTITDRYASPALFHAIGPDGTTWLFVVKVDGSWAIMRDGNEFDLGTGEPASVIKGVKNFLSISHIIADFDVASDPVLMGLLDRIDRGRSMATSKQSLRSRNSGSLAAV